MTQALFRIGGVYRNRRGSPLRIAREIGGGLVKLSHPDGSIELFSNWKLADGQYEHGPHATADLLPGELHQVDGRWLTQEEASTLMPMAPYFAEALEESPDEPWIESWELLDIANAAMIARDGPARPPAPVVIQEPAKTSHSPIAGLTFLENRDHRFGSFRF